MRPWFGPLIPHFAARQILVILKRTDKVRWRISPSPSSWAVVWKAALFPSVDRDTRWSMEPRTHSWKLRT